MSNSSFSVNDFLNNILLDSPYSQSHQVISSSAASDDISGRNSNSTFDNGETEADKWELDPVDERKRKRLISNRESAKRSRMRKQKHLENLTNQFTRYHKCNQELMKRLRFVTHNGQVIRQENQRLQVESLRLQQKLHILSQLIMGNYQELHHSILLPSAWPCNNINVANNINNEQNQPSLITY